MNYQEMMALVEQYQSNGGNAGDFPSFLNSMAANGKTPLGLNQWQLNDKPLMAEFNSDNQIIDEKLRRLTTEKVSTLEVIDTGSIKELVGRSSGNFTITPDVTDMPRSGAYWRAQTVSTGQASGTYAGIWIHVVNASNAKEQYTLLCNNGVWDTWVQLATL